MYLIKPKCMKTGNLAPGISCDSEKEEDAIKEAESKSRLSSFPNWDFTMHIKKLKKKQTTSKKQTMSYKDKIVEFNGYKCKIGTRPYMSGQTYAVLVDVEDGQQVSRFSLSMDNVPVIENLVIIKSYSENEGVYEALLRADAIYPCERKIPVGFEFAQVCMFKD